MNDPQVWTLIGVFTTIMLGGMTLMTTLVNRALTHAIRGVEGRIEGLDGKIEGLRGEMNARFDAVNTRIDHLDRDVNLLMRRAWGEPTAE